MIQSGLIIKLLFPLFLFLIVIACTFVPHQAYPHEFTIIGTADLQGCLEPVGKNIPGKKEYIGGIPEIGTLIKKIRNEKHKNMVVVSVGDDLMHKFFHIYKGKAIFHLMAMAGYEIFVPGNHEFDKGPEIFGAALESAEFKCICSDLKIKTTPLEGLCKPWLIRTFDGIKVGFFSLITEDFSFITSGGTVEPAGTNIQMARKMVKELRKRKAQIIVALTHVGYLSDRKIAEAVSGIDVIFGGHSHKYLSKLVRIKKTIIVNGGEKGKFLVQLDLYTDCSDKFQPDKTKFKLIPVKNIKPDAKIEAVLEKYKKSLPGTIVLGRTDVKWNMSEDKLRKGESNVADMINDLMRKKFNVDFVLNNSGAFRGKKVYPPGSVTDTMLKEIDEFGNYAYICSIKGKYIKKILERSAACYGRGGLLQVSGLRYTINLKKTPQKIKRSSSGNLIVSVKGNRVTAIQIFGSNGKWSEIIPDKPYKILSNNYLVNQQGDGYFWFKEFAYNIQNTYSTFYSILAEIVVDKGVLNPGRPDGRLTIIK